MRTLNVRVIAATTALFLLAAGCSSESEATADGIATLETDSGSAVGDAADAHVVDNEEEELAADEAALEFSACMRDEGLDFPDIAVDAEGRINLREGFEGVDRGDETFQAAIEVCQPLIEAVGFGQGGRANIGENVEIQDALVEFSACVRQAGYDVGDLTLGGPGQGGGDGADGDGTPPERGQGQGQDGFGDPSARFADQLGLDYEDPEVAAVVDDCSSALTEAFTANGAGRG